jgi:hypothetical protein
MVAFIPFCLPLFFKLFILGVLTPPGKQNKTNPMYPLEQWYFCVNCRHRAAGPSTQCRGGGGGAGAAGAPGPAADQVPTAPIGFNGNLLTVGGVPPMTTNYYF